MVFLLVHSFSAFCRKAKAALFAYANMRFGKAKRHQKKRSEAKVKGSNALPGNSAG